MMHIQSTCSASKLGSLVQELCPSGVRYARIADIAVVLRGKRLTKSELSENGDYPVYHGGLEPLGFYSKSNREAMTMIINVGASAGTVGFCEKAFWSSDGCFCVSYNECTLPKYVYYAVANQERSLVSKVRKAGIPTLDAKVVEDIRIPLPPLPVQREIVRILDSFTELTAELNKSLEEEVSARRKQYEHYRDELLQNPTNSTMMTLGAIADYRRGSFPQPYGNSEWYGGVGAMPFVQVADVEENGMVLREQTKQQISVVAQSKSVYVPAGTVICSIQGSIGRVAITQYDAYVDRTLAIFEKYKTDINKRYFAYQIQRKFGIEKEFARGSTLKTITKEEFTKFEIPVPPITEQERIVSVLDRFDTLCNDLTSGLPSEIAARQKQYEYYRDRLLTFKEWDA